MTVTNLNIFLQEDHPILVYPRLATLIGLNEAIMLQQIKYWIVKNKKEDRNFVDGKYWTYNSTREWQEQFPFWCERTIKTIMKNLLDMKLIISENHHQDPFKKSKWYTLNEEKIQNFTNRLGKNCTIRKMGDTDTEGPENPEKSDRAIFAQSTVKDLPNDTETTTDILRERENAEVILLDEWKVESPNFIKNEYKLTTEQFEQARKEFLLHSKANNKNYETMYEIDNAFELWCSRFHEMKKRYTKKNTNTTDSKPVDHDKVALEWVEQQPEIQKHVFMALFNKMGGREFLNNRITLTAIEVDNHRISFKAAYGVIYASWVGSYRQVIIDALAAFKTIKELILFNEVPININEI